MPYRAPPQPPPTLLRVGSLFLYRCLVFQRNVLKGKSEYFGVIQIKRLKSMGFQHIQSNQIWINLTLFDDIV